MSSLGRSNRQKYQSLFGPEVDPKLHEWIQSKYDEKYEVLWHEKDPSRKRAIQAHGEVKDVKYVYSLSLNGEWIRRTQRK